MYQTLSQLKSDIANLREGQIVATIEDEYSESTFDEFSERLDNLEKDVDDLQKALDDYYTKEETDEELEKKQDKIQIVDTKDDLELEDGELGIAKEDGLFYQDGDDLLNVSGKGTGDGIAFTGTAEELEEALKIPEGEEGYLPPNSLVLILDEDEELSE